MLLEKNASLQVLRKFEKSHEKGVFYIKTYKLAKLTYNIYLYSALVSDYKEQFFINIYCIYQREKCKFASFFQKTA